MSSGFQQQTRTRGVFTRSVPEPQNGKRSDETALTQKSKPSRSFDPRPRLI
jgi:hypothetical protein